MAVKTITLLERNNVTIQPYTNNLAAYNAMLKQMLPKSGGKIPSYATINRKVQAAGDSIDLACPLGVFTIRKVLLLPKAA